MEKKKSEFDKVFSAWDILVIAFGAMIGWGWVVSTGDWIGRGGVLGAVIGFAIGGIMVFFVGLTYAELTAAMPQCGGEHVFSYKAMGPVGSFICTWAIILGYVSVVCFEACALPTIITYIYPGFLKGYLYTVAGFDIYASWLAVAMIVAFFYHIYQYQRCEDSCNFTDSFNSDHRWSWNPSDRSICSQWRCQQFNTTIICRR